jgi:hypothetical protein
MLRSVFRNRLCKSAWLPHATKPTDEQSSLDLQVGETGRLRRHDSDLKLGDLEIKMVDGVSRRCVSADHLPIVEGGLVFLSDFHARFGVREFASAGLQNEPVVFGVAFLAWFDFYPPAPEAIGLDLPVLRPGPNQDLALIYDGPLEVLAVVGAEHAESLGGDVKLDRDIRSAKDIFFVDVAFKFGVHARHTSRQFFNLAGEDGDFSRGNGCGYGTGGNSRDCSCSADNKQVFRR